MADDKTKEEKKQPTNPNRPFEGTLRYVATDGRWVAGAPSRDITADDWEAGGYSSRGNFTPDDLVATGLYVLEPTKTKSDTSTGNTPKTDTGTGKEDKPDDN